MITPTTPWAVRWRTSGCEVSCTMYTCWDNETVSHGVAVVVALAAITIMWKCTPIAFRQRRPVGLRVAMGCAAVGVTGVLVPSCGAHTLEDAEAALTFGFWCAEALALLMVFDLIAYVRRPSSIPRARVTHGA